MIFFIVKCIYPFANDASTGIKTLLCQMTIVKMVQRYLTTFWWLSAVEIFASILNGISLILFMSCDTYKKWSVIYQIQKSTDLEEFQFLENLTNDHLLLLILLQQNLEESDFCKFSHDLHQNNNSNVAEIPSTIPDQTEQNV